jgi:nucleoside-diphosphate-sugar epimerase
MRIVSSAEETSVKIFLVGGSGALGSAAIPALVASGHTVTSTASTPEKAARVRAAGAAARTIDIYSVPALREAIRGFDAVARLTTRIPPLAKMRELTAWNETNRLRTTGAHALVEACVAEKISVYISESVAFVYADGGEQELDESAPIDHGGSAVLRAAMAGEEEAWHFVRNGGRAVVLRFGGLYGPEDPTTEAMAAMMEKRQLPLIGAGQAYRPALFLSDAGSAVAYSLLAPTGSYNVADDEPLRLKEVMRAMAAVLDAPRPLHLPGVMGALMFGHVWKYFSRSQRVSNAAFKHATGWAPAVRSAREGWQLIAEAARASRASGLARGASA